MKITRDLLLLNGFNERTFPKTDNKLVIYNIWTGDAPCLVININGGEGTRENMNSDADWVVYVDNDRCEAIGHAELDTVEQFNKLMEVFGSNFRLDPDL